MHTGWDDDQQRKIEEAARANGRSDAYMNIILGLTGRSWLEIEGDKPGLHEYQQQAIEAALLSAISAGSIETDEEVEAIVQICEEWNIPNVFDTWDADMQRAIAQNRRVLGLDTA